MKQHFDFKQEQPFHIVEDLMRLHYDALTTDEDDRVVIITGDTGSGKSNFAKHLFHIWYSKILAEKNKKDQLQFFCFGLKDWTTALKNIYEHNNKYRMLYNDEAINILYYRDSTSKSSKLIKKNFNIIRYLNTYHILTIPHCHELDAEIVRNRVCGMWYLHKYNGKRVASYFSQQSLLNIIAEIKDTIAQKANKRGKVPRVTDTKAFQNRMFYVYPSLYTGWVDDAYMDNKHEQAGEAVSELYEHTNPNKSKNEKVAEKANYYIQKTAQAKKLISEGMTMTQATRQVGIAKDTFYKYQNHEENIVG